MSNKELDNLFKNKLEDFEKSPASSLWDRIDEKIEQPKKRSPWIYLSIAASLLLLISLSYMFLKNDIVTTDSQQVIASKNTETAINANDAVAVEEAITEPSETEPEAVQNSVKEEVIEQSKEAQKPTTTKKKEFIQLPPASELTASNNTKDAKEEIKTLDNKDEVVDLKIDELTSNTTAVAQISTPDATIPETSASEVKKSKGGQTLVFDISQFEDSKTTVAATDTDKKESKLLQIFNKAKELKQGEGGLGEIRAAKNNILAFNGKKEGK
ncbi:hypothetical protein [Fulvivirga sp.]|uniref:hypothetical protein n=1 Tax=Fulvivirga sp. TaxID=1931237 RepID=UPI0032EB986E